MNTKQDKLKNLSQRFIWKYIMIKLLKTNKQKTTKNLKSSKRGVTGQIQGILKNLSQWNEGQNHNVMMVQNYNKVTLENSQMCSN